MGFVCCLPSFLRLLLLLVLASLVGLPNKTDDRQPRTLQSAGSPRSERSRANAPPPPSSQVTSHVRLNRRILCVLNRRKKKIKELVSIDRHLLCLFPLRPRAGSPLKPSPHLGIQRPAETTCKSWHSYTRRTVLFFFFFLALLWSAIIKKERKKERREKSSICIWWQNRARPTWTNFHVGKRSGSNRNCLAQTKKLVELSPRPHSKCNRKYQSLISSFKEFLIGAWLCYVSTDGNAR